MATSSASAQHRARTAPAVGGRRAVKREAPMVWQLQEALRAHAERPVLHSGFSVSAAAACGVVLGEPTNDAAFAASPPRQRRTALAWGAEASDHALDCGGSWPRIRYQRTPTGSTSAMDIQRRFATVAAPGPAPAPAAFERRAAATDSAFDAATERATDCFLGSVFAASPGRTAAPGPGAVLQIAGGRPILREDSLPDLRAQMAHSLVLPTPLAADEARLGGPSAYARAGELYAGYAAPSAAAALSAVAEFSEQLGEHLGLSEHVAAGPDRPEEALVRDTAELASLLAAAPELPLQRPAPYPPLYHQQAERHAVSFGLQAELQGYVDHALPVAGELDHGVDPAHERSYGDGYADGGYGDGGYCVGGYVDGAYGGGDYGGAGYEFAPAGCYGVSAGPPLPTAVGYAIPAGHAPLAQYPPHPYPAAGAFAAEQRGGFEYAAGGFDPSQGTVVRPMGIASAGDAVPPAPAPKGPRNRAARREWSAEEDALIAREVASLGFRWRRIAVLLPGRSDDAVRNRYNRLQEEEEASPEGEGRGRRQRRGEDEARETRISWSREEDAVIVSSIAELGHKWYHVATRLPGRTEHAIRNRYQRLQAYVQDAPATSADLGADGTATLLVLSH